MYFLLKKDYEKEFHTLVRDLVKQTTKIWKTMILQKPSKYVIYLDEHNLYGQPMSRYLPYGWFKRLK